MIDGLPDIPGHPRLRFGESATQASCHECGRPAAFELVVLNGQGHSELREHYCALHATAGGDRYRTFYDALVSEPD